MGVLISLINMNLKSQYAIFELGTSNFYEIGNLVSLVKPSQTIITNIYPTHLEKLINTRNVAIEKILQFYESPCHLVNHEQDLTTPHRRCRTDRDECGAQKY